MSSERVAAAAAPPRVLARWVRKERNCTRVSRNLLSAPVLYFCSLGEGNEAAGRRRRLDVECSLGRSVDPACGLGLFARALGKLEPVRLAGTVSVRVSFCLWVLFLLSLFQECR